MKTFTKFLFLTLLVNFSLRSQTPELLKDLTGDSEDGINFYGIESASSSNNLYFQGKPFFSTKIMSSTGAKGNAEELGFNDSLFDPKLLTMSGTNLFFIARGSTNGLYAYNESSKKVSFLVSTKGGDNFGIFPMKNNSALLVKSKTFASKPDEIWFSNGTMAGTSLIYESLDFPSILDFTRLGDALIISDGSTDINQKQAIITDGTKSGTLLVKDYIKTIINLDLIDDAYGIGNNLILFAKNSNGKNSNYIISASGSLKDIGYLGSINNVALLKSKFIIDAGRELNSYDTASSKMELLADISSFEYSYSGIDRYFFTKDGSSKKELWETDGTKAGTIKISDNIGKLFLNSYNAVTKGSILHYLKDVGSSIELWEYDYVSKINKKLTDLYQPASIGFTPTLFYFKNNLFFGKESTKEGFELWFINLSTAVENLDKSNKNIAYFDPNNKEIVINKEFEGVSLKVQLVNLDGRVSIDLGWKTDSRISLKEISKNGIYVVNLTDGKQSQNIKVLITN